MGAKIVPMGEVGMGTSIKMVVNMLLATSMAAFAEGMALGESLGIPQETLFNILIGGPVVAPFVAGKRAKMEAGDYDVEFPLRWMHKDLRLAADTAAEVEVPLPLANLTKDLFLQAVEGGAGDDDFSAIYARR
jgi:3-hydroxyisobutyrate dehydrogenase/glyoxylate/succinic semialdehyde reductase